MKFSEQWLREWVNPELSTQELGACFTMAGLELEAIEPIANEFSGVIIGDVIELLPIKSEDKPVYMAAVNIGEKNALTIVTTATNVYPGMKLPIATVGAILDMMHAPEKIISRVKLYGVMSDGMFCGGADLGLQDMGDGVIELPNDAPVGIDFRQYLELNDVAMTLNLTPNRGDCLSIQGLAQELSALQRLPVNAVEIRELPTQCNTTQKVIITANEQCPHYVGRVIENINPGAMTPIWLREKLRRSEIRSIHPVVDVLNYVMLELGQPMHAFDLAKIQGTIEVRLAKQDELLTLLDDNRQITLQPNTLVIADEKEAIALAGVMGGANTAVSAETYHVFLESAFFTPDSVAGRARQYGLNTDGAFRFERGVSPDLQRQAIHRATELLLEIVGGKAGPITEVNHDAYLPVLKTIPFRLSRLNRILGFIIPEEEVASIFHYLNFQVFIQGEAWQVTVPARRFDITREEDLIEEVLRLYGYHHCPVAPPIATLEMPALPEKLLTPRYVQETLKACGYQEIISYSFVDTPLQNLLFPDVKEMALLNPISPELAVMRVSLWPSLLKTIVYNQNRQQPRLRLFEVGKRFYFQNKNSSELIEEVVVAGALTGMRFPLQWAMDKSQNTLVDFFDVKATVMQLLNLTRLPADAFEWMKSEAPALHPGQSAEIRYQDKVVAILGAIHPKIQAQLGIDENVYVFEIKLNDWWQLTLPQYKPLSKFQSVRRDLALVCKSTVAAGALTSAIREAAGPLLQEVVLFDKYEGDKLPQGQKSMALALILQDATRTMQDKEINVVVDKVIERVAKQFGATLRE